MKYRNKKGQYAKDETAEKLLIAIGDIHGCIRALKLLIKTLSEKYDLNSVRLVFLGDYIDRGESSKEVLDFLIMLKLKYPHFVFILGNHEAMFLQGELWGVHGKENVLFSYENFRMPEEHIEFLRCLTPFYESNKFVFVHGGIPTGYADIKEVPVKEMIWEYGVARGYKGKTVLRGHQADTDVRASANNICIDTGATYRFNGKLTAAVLNDRTGKVVEYVQVQNPMYPKQEKTVLLGETVVASYPAYRCENGRVAA